MRRQKKSARLKTRKRDRLAAMPGMPIIAAGILGIGLASAIFYANDRSIREAAIRVRLEPTVAVKEILEAPKPEIAAIPAPAPAPAEPEIITGSIPAQEPIATSAPLPHPKATIAKKKTPPKENNSVVNFLLQQEQLRNQRP